MDFVKLNTQYYCGIDLHANSMYICVMNKEGDILLHRNLRTEFREFKRKVKKFLPDLSVGAESTYNYYWLADACRHEGIPFYLGHAYYMKTIHGGKKKNDKLDSRKIADLLRSNHFPLAYAYPDDMRSTRDLLRRRHRYAYIRAEAYTHIQTTFHQNGKSIHPSAVKDKKKRHLLVDEFDDSSIRKTIEADLDMIYFLDPKIQKLELYIRQTAREHDRSALNILRSIPGVGDMLSLIILYEIQDISRFPTVQQFCSYARLVRGAYESAGKKVGRGKAKIGNHFLKFAIAEIIMKATIPCREIAEYYNKLESQNGKARARTIISHKFGIAIYYMLKNKQVFDAKQFVQSNMK